MKTSNVLCFVLFLLAIASASALHAPVITRDAILPTGFLSSGVAIARAGHVSPGFFESTFDAAKRLFASCRTQIWKEKRRFSRGCIHLAQESGGKSIEVKEGFSLGFHVTSNVSRNEMELENIWPESVDDEVKRTLENTFEVFADVGISFATESLGFSQDLFNDAKRISVLRIFHYFGMGSKQWTDLGCMSDQVDCIGSSQHTDWGALTLIAIEPGGEAALEFQNQETGEWETATVPRNDDEVVFLLNIGDFLAISSNFSLVSPIHRVRLLQEDRWSFVFFLYPSYDAKLPRHINAEDHKLERLSLLKDQSQGRKGMPFQKIWEENLPFGEIMARKWQEVSRKSSDTCESND